jgi:hypothetical protein
MKEAVENVNRRNRLSNATKGSTGQYDVSTGDSGGEVSDSFIKETEKSAQDKAREVNWRREN